VGQSIEVMSRAIVGDVAIFAIDRGLTGMDGHAFDSAEAAEAAPGFPALLAERIFRAVDGIERVFVFSNDVIVQRTDGWGEDPLDAASSVIEGLFRYYPD
jgi:hypothetical protein